MAALRLAVASRTGMCIPSSIRTGNFKMALFASVVKRLAIPCLRIGIGSLNRYCDNIDAASSKIPTFLRNIRTFHNNNLQSNVNLPIKISSLPLLPFTMPPVSQTSITWPILDPVDTTEKYLPELFDLGKMAPKMAAKLIVIRRKKMRKHKLRKLRKRMKYVWEKRDARRAKRRERKFQDEILSQIRHAKQFDAQIWVQEFLAKSNAPLPIPSLPSKPRP